MQKTPRPHLRPVPSYQENLDLKSFENLVPGDLINLSTQNSTYHVKVICEYDGKHLIGLVKAGNNDYINYFGIIIIAEEEDGFHLVIEKVGSSQNFFKSTKITGMTVDRESEISEIPEGRVKIIKLISETTHQAL